MGNETKAIRVVLGTKKEVILREPKIADQNMAMQIAAGRAKDNPLLLVAITQTEMLKLLVMEIDGTPVSRQQIEKLDELFSLAEYNQVVQVVGRLSGGSDMGECQIEL